MEVGKIKPNQWVRQNVIFSVLFEIDNICDCTVEYLNKVKGSTDVAIITKSSAVFS